MAHEARQARKVSAIEAMPMYLCMPDVSQQIWHILIPAMLTSARLTAEQHVFVTYVVMMENALSKVPHAFRGRQDIQASDSWMM